MIVVVATLTGSSPLTRGKRERRVDGGDKGRLIPAHAGKTRCRLRRQWPRWAHPRSRGENTSRANIAWLGDGSSPLTRGKPPTNVAELVLHRLIPAHAGKTMPSRPFVCTLRAHPRSRGENSAARSFCSLAAGSSPLTRGKQVPVTHAPDPSRLIPAHAGKTRTLDTRERERSAHPRSRGENASVAASEEMFRGSSPLTRGKLRRIQRLSRGRRLIPAHAGKTVGVDNVGYGVQAHPRSRGENRRRRTSSRSSVGSSPLTRGKRMPVCVSDNRFRLIPAHAGKTLSSSTLRVTRWAHPRSRGENTSRPALLLRRSIRSWKPLSLPSPLEVTQFGSLAQLTRRRIRFGVLASSFRVVGAHHECESIEVNGLPGIAPRQEGESLLVARTKDHDSPTRFHVLSDDVPQALAYTGAERPHEDPRGNLHEPPRHVTSQPLGHRGQDQDDHQESLSS